MVHGSVFSTIPSCGIVMFDGTQATLSSVTISPLQVFVPSGATTGTISVMVGANTATSADTFTVHGDLSPSITDVTGPSPTYPHVVNYGDRILIQGTNLCSADLKQCNVSIDDTSARAVITPPGPVGL